MLAREIAYSCFLSKPAVQKLELYKPQIRHQVCKGIWHAVRKLHLGTVLPCRMLIRLKAVFEGQLIEIAVVNISSVLLNVHILEEFDIEAP